MLGSFPGQKIQGDCGSVSQWFIHVIHYIRKGIPEFLLGDDLYMMLQPGFLGNFCCLADFVVAVSFIKSYGKSLVCT